MLTGVPKPKPKANNFSLDQALIAEAKELEVNVPTVAKVGLRKAIAARRAALWLEENREAIDENNRYFSEHGLPFAEFRNY